MPPKPKTTTNKLFEGSGDSQNPYASEVDRLSKEVEELKDKLGDVIFICVFITILIADFFILPNSNSWSGPLVIGLLELAFLFVVARICRVNDIVRLTDTILDGIERYKGGPPPNTTK